MDCKLCKNPVKQAQGQIVNYHKECRTKGRRMERLSIKKQ